MTGPRYEAGIAFTPYQIDNHAGAFYLASEDAANWSEDQMAAFSQIGELIASDRQYAKLVGGLVCYPSNSSVFVVTRLPQVLAIGVLVHDE